MDFPTIFQWLDRFEFLRGLPAAYGVLVTAFFILIAWDWRLTLLALVLQYMIAGFLFVDLLDPRLANIKVLVGLFVCLMLYITGRQVNWGRLPDDVSEQEAAHWSRESEIRVGSFVLPTTRPFRVFVTLLMLLVVLTLSQRSEYQLPAVPAELGHISLAIYALIGMGLLSMGLSSEPIMVGAGMLTFLTGFELFYSALEQSVAVLVVLAAVNLALTLAIALLTQAHYALPELLD